MYWEYLLKMLACILTLLGLPGFVIRPGREYHRNTIWVSKSTRYQNSEVSNVRGITCPKFQMYEMSNLLGIQRLDI